MSESIIKKIKRWNKAERLSRLKDNIVLVEKQNDAANTFVSIDYFNVSNGKHCKKNKPINSAVDVPPSDIISSHDLAHKNFAIFPTNFFSHNYYIYVEHVSELSLLIISFFDLDQNVSINESTWPIEKSPKEIERFYITKDKQFFRHKKARTYLPNNPVVIKSIEITDEVEESTPADFGFTMNKYGCTNKAAINGEHFEEYIKEAEKCFGPIYSTGPNTYHRINLSLDEFVRFLLLKEPPASTNRKTLYNDLFSPEYENKLSNKNYDPELGERVILIDNLNVETTVIRGMLNIEGSPFMIEHIRIYLHDNNKYLFWKNSNNEWIPYPLERLNAFEYSVSDFECEKIKNSRLKYIVASLFKCAPFERGNILFFSIKYPWFKKIMDSGLSTFARYLYLNKRDSALSLFNMYIDNFNQNADNVKKMTGLNSYQISRFHDFYKKLLSKSETSYANFIRTVKASLSFNEYWDNIYSKYSEPDAIADIRNIDNETFDIVFDALSSCAFDFLSGKTHINIVPQMCKITFLLSKCYGLKTMRRVLKKIKYCKYTNILNSTEKVQRPFFEMLLHYLWMAQQTCCCDIFKVEIDQYSFNKFINNYNSLSAVYNTLPSKKSEYFGFNEYLFDQWVEEYDLSYTETGCRYSIIMPKSSGDVVLEGYALHNFAKKCIESISQGQTMVVFLRDLNTPSESYYTIEIDKDYNLTKVAGFADYFPTGNEKVLSFISRWCKEKMIGNSLF